MVVLGTGELVGIAIATFTGLMLLGVVVEKSGYIDPPGQGGVVARGKKSHSKSKKRTKKNK